MKTLVFIFILIQSLIFTFVVPPFQKPDEDSKFYRIVSLSRGQFFCYLNKKGEKVLSIPRKFYELPHLYQVDEIKFHSDRKLLLNISDVRKQLNAIGYEEIETSKGCYSYFVGFIPNTVGFLFGLLFKDLIVQFYLGRLAGLLLFIFTFWYALKIIPRPFHIILYLYGMLPMVLHQVTAYNNDVFFLSMIPLVFSGFIKLYSERMITTKFFALYQTSIHLLVLAKPISIPFIFFHLLLPSAFFLGRKKSFLILSIFFFLFSLATGFYFYFLRR